MALLNDFYEVEFLDYKEHVSLQFKVTLNKTHDIFKGHFPKFKVTPGVVMLQILKNVLEDQTKLRLKTEQLSQVKFLNLVEPEKNDVLVFEVALTSEEKKINTKTKVTFPDDTLVLKCNATFVSNL